MDLEKRARRASRRVIISEVLMVLTVIVTVAILALVVSGYWVGSDFKVERQGLLQISSIPTGADVEIDGTSSWLQRTNTSKVLSSGEHTIKLTKEGYDSWSRTINIAEGLLYRVSYPRLFLQKRTKSTVYDAAAATFATVSPDRNTLVLASGASNWVSLPLDADQVNPRPLTLPADFPFLAKLNGSEDSVFNGNIVAAEWARDNEHLLLELQSADGATTAWFLLNVKDPAHSLNLTSVFSTDFSSVKIADHSASVLLVVTGGDLRRIDVSSRQLSAVLVPSVTDYDYYDSTIVFSAKSSDAAASAPVANTVSSDNPASSTDSTEPSAATPYYVGTIRYGDAAPKSLLGVAAPVEVAIGKFYEDEYIAVLNGTNLSFYKRSDFSPLFSDELDFSPTTLKVGKNGEFVAAYTDGLAIATADLEARLVTKWSASSREFGWLDGHMVYSVADGTLSVYDFDGENHRTLCSNVSSRFPVTISADKWLYYFSDGTLTRERVAD